MTDLSGFKVGIAWWGSIAATDPYAWPARRAVPLAEFAALAAVPGVSLVNLQLGAGREQLREIDFAVRDLGPDRSIEDDAALMMNCDLIVSLDGAPCHLAGALGRPVWTAVPSRGEWRWLKGESTPWYPTMRSRRNRPGDWTGVFRRMAEAPRERTITCP